MNALTLRQPAVWLALWAMLAAGCSFQPEHSIQVLQGRTMGTTYTVKVVTDGSTNLDALQQGIDARLQAVNDAMSTYLPDSAISRFNQAPIDEWFPVTDEFVHVVAIAQQIAAWTDGEYDVTVGPLVNLWGFGPDYRPSAVPSAADITAARERLGYQALQYRESPAALNKSKSLYVDLSSVAKGHGVDAVADWLEAQGIDRYLVEIGGEVRSGGLKPDGEPWRLAIEQPGEGRAVHRVVALSGPGLATSGDYRNYFEEDGVRYSHTISPRTGAPVQHRLASVSVIHASTAWADALATAFMVIGPEQGYDLAVEKGIAAYFIVRDEAGFSTLTSPAFQPYLQDLESK